METLDLVQRIAIWVIPVLFAVTLHEVGHGWVAKQLGDPTAQMLGRLSLNPLRHIDPLGTVVIPITLLVLTGYVFGWAKPVPVTWENLHRPKRDMALVALAGPGANLVMALIWVLVIQLGVMLLSGSSWAALPMIFMGVAGIFINVILMVLNLLPLPPLDGGRVLTGILPGPWAYQVSRIEPYGLFILVFLMFSGALGSILSPMLSLVADLFANLAGLSPQSFIAALGALMGH